VLILIMEVFITSFLLSEISMTRNSSCEWYNRESQYSPNSPLAQQSQQHVLRDVF